MMTTERWLALPALKALGYSVNTRSDDSSPRSRRSSGGQAELLAYDDTTSVTGSRAARP